MRVRTHTRGRVMCLCLCSACVSVTCVVSVCVGGVRRRGAPKLPGTHPKGIGVITIYEGTG